MYIVFNQKSIYLNAIALLHNLYTTYSCGLLPVTSILRIHQGRHCLQKTFIATTWLYCLHSGYIVVIYISFSSCNATAEKRKVCMCLMYIKHAEKATRWTMNIKKTNVGCYSLLFNRAKTATPRTGWVIFYLYMRWHSHGVGWAGITNRVDHVSDGGTSGASAQRLSPSPLAIVRDRRLAVRRGAPGLLWSWSPTSSAGLQFVCAMFEAAWEGEGPWSAHLRDVLLYDQTSRAFFERAAPVYL